jgi:hypothetical protein
MMTGEPGTEHELKQTKNATINQNSANRKNEMDDSYSGDNEDEDKPRKQNIENLRQRAQKLKN